MSNSPHGHQSVILSSLSKQSVNSDFFEREFDNSSESHHDPNSHYGNGVGNSLKADSCFKLNHSPIRRYNWQQFKKKAQTPMKVQLADVILEEENEMTNVKIKELDSTRQS